MSDVEAILAAFSSGALLRPSANVLNLVDLSRGIAALAGAGDRAPTPGAGAIADLVGPAEHLVFVLVDGMGMNLLEMLPAGAFLRQSLAADLQTVFPSTTAVALTTIATGQWPLAHGITGWWTHLPEIGAAASILQYIKRSDRRSLIDHRVGVDQAFLSPSAYRSFRRDTLALFPDRIAYSVYTNFFCGGLPRRGYRNLREAVNLAIERVNRAREGTYTYLYTNRIDDEAHRWGLCRPEVPAAVIDTDRELERLAAGIGKRGRIVISADHGFLDSGRTEKHQIRATDSIMEFLRFPPSGDARVMCLHVREGAENQVREHFQQRAGDRFWLLTLDEVEALELLGPGLVSPDARRRFGDMLAISRGRDVIEYRPPGNNGRFMEEASQHSGLTPEEMRVPLIIA
jgi:hypothetical protein